MAEHAHCVNQMLRRIALLSKQHARAPKLLVFFGWNREGCDEGDVVRAVWRSKASVRNRVNEKVPADGDLAGLALQRMKHPEVRAMRIITTHMLQKKAPTHKKHLLEEGCVTMTRAARRSEL